MFPPTWEILYVNISNTYWHKTFRETKEKLQAEITLSSNELEQKTKEIENKDGQIVELQDVLSIAKKETESDHLKLAHEMRSTAAAQQEAAAARLEAATARLEAATARNELVELQSSLEERRILDSSNWGGLLAGHSGQNNVILLPCL